MLRLPPPVTGSAVALALVLVSATAILLDSPPAPNPRISLPPGFVVETVSTGWALPSALDFGTGGAFGSDLYVGDWSDDAIYRLDVSTGSRTPLASGLPDPGVILFGPGGAFSPDLYVITNDGNIHVLGATGSRTVFTTVATPFARDMDFDPTGRFGGDLFVMDTAGALSPPGDKILRVKPDGSSSLFAMRPEIPEENAWGLAFGRGSFGTDLFISFGRSTLIGTSRPSVFRVDPAGSGFLHAEVPDFEELSDFVLSEGGPFGDYLYVADVFHDRLYRASPSGTVETWASGFQFNRHISTDMVFGPDGALYVAEDGTGSILRIRPEVSTPSPASVDCDPDTFKIGSEGQWIVCYLEPEGGRNADEIEALAVRLDSWLAPVLDEQHGFSWDPGGYLVDHDADGVQERLLKFDRQLLADTLEPGVHVFLIEGEYADGNAFEAMSEAIKVLEG